MLDECKGEKLLELLLQFSTLVLKKTLRGGANAEKKQTMVNELSNASSLSERKQDMILPLAIAHEVSLRSAARSKERERVRYAEFSADIDLKIEEVSRRRRECEGRAKLQKSNHSTKSKSNSVATKEQVSTNWRGNQEWLDTFLQGDSTSSVNVPSYLEARSNKSRSKRTKNQSNPGLLENLERRVAHHNDQLERWQEFNAKLNGKDRVSEKTSTIESKQENTLNFDRHQELQLGNSKSGQDDRKQRLSGLSSANKYEEIISRMKSDLLRSMNSRSVMLVSIQGAPPSMRSGLPIFSRQKQTDKEEQRSQARKETTLQKSRNKASDSEIVVKAEASNDRGQDTQEKPPTSSHPDAVIEATKQDDFATLIDQSIKFSPPRTPPRNEFSPKTGFSPPSSPPLPDSPNLAADILTSITAATPSPKKKSQPRPSLTERTRQSMFGNGASHLSPLAESSPALPELPEQSIPTHEPNRRATLLERTRQSMSMLQPRPVEESPSDCVEAPRPKEVRKARKSRTSLFPVNQFETPPQKQRTKRVSAVSHLKEGAARPSFYEAMDNIEEAETEGVGTGTGTSTPKEILFSDEAEYASVFKSRPRVAISPVPQSEGNSRLLPDDVAEGEDEGEDDEGVGGWENSPLANFRDRLRQAD